MFVREAEERANEAGTFEGRGRREVQTSKEMLPWNWERDTWKLTGWPGC